MGVVGNYVKTFAEATHAMPVGMHMNSDYPFMLPQVVERKGGKVLLRDGSNEEWAPVISGKPGEEYAVLKQSSTYERLFKVKPRTWRFYPFKGESY